jgi:heat shock protein HslJ
MDGLVARGDLNGDGVDEAVVLLVENSGGTGSFFYVAVVADQGGQPVNIAMGTLGDRVQVKSMVVGQGLLHTEIITQGPVDAFCCPTLRLRQTFNIQGDQLVETARQELGKVSYKDLDGTSWQLIETDIGHPVLPGSQITASFAGNTVSGSAGCNSYSADVTPGDLQAFAIGNAVATLMACADPVMMDQEAQFLKALGGVTSWFYLTGQLALNYQAGDASGSLVFAPQPATAP